MIPGSGRSSAEGTTHSSILAWKILWTEETGGYSPWGRKELDMTEQLSKAQKCNGNQCYKGEVLSLVGTYDIRT